MFFFPITLCSIAAHCLVEPIGRRLLGDLGHNTSFIRATNSFGSGRASPLTLFATASARDGTRVSNSFKSSTTAQLRFGFVLNCFGKGSLGDLGCLARLLPAVAGLVGTQRLTGAVDGLQSEVFSLRHESGSLRLSGMFASPHTRDGIRLERAVWGRVHPLTFFFATTPFVRLEVAEAQRRRLRALPARDVG